jgi:serine/threonine protein kinase
LKAGNVLLTNQGRARLTDFGVSAALGKEAKKRMTIIGSPYWMAPEVIQEVGYSFPADIWGLGITIIEMAEMMPPRAEMQPMKVLLKIPTLPSPTLEHPKSFSPEMSHFLELALKKSPTLRSTAEQLAQHPWLGGAAPTRVVELVKQGFEMIRKCGGREAAMRNRRFDFLVCLFSF